jgi:glycosyltransferase involved in cell wall biosynthesis
MRIGWIVDGPLDQRSGGYLYDSIVVDHLRSHRIEVEVISMPTRPYATRLAFGSPTSLAEHIAGAPVDLLVQDELSHPALIGLNRRLARARPHLPRVALVHHLRSSEPGPWAARFFFRRVEAAYLRSATGFIFNSRTTREAVRRLRREPAPFTVAVPGADRLPAAAGDPDRHTSPGPLRLLFVGNLIPRKRLPVVIEALALLPPETAALTVVGDQRADPTHARRVLELVRRYRLQDRVGFLGPLGSRRVAAEMAVANVLAMPSTYEGYGMAFLEGMGFGLPPVAGRDGGAAEFIRDGENGFLVDPDDAPALAALLLSLHRDRARLARLGRSALETHRKHPTWRQTGEAVAEFLRGLADETPPPP